MSEKSLKDTKEIQDDGSMERELPPTEIDPKETVELEEPHQEAMSEDLIESFLSLVVNY